TILIPAWLLASAAGALAAKPDAPPEASKSNATPGSEAATDQGAQEIEVEHTAFHDPHPVNALIIRPIDMAAGFYNIEFEHAFMERLSVYAGFGMTRAKSSYYPALAKSGYAMAPEAGARFFLLGDAPIG